MAIDGQSTQRLASSSSGFDLTHHIGLPEKPIMASIAPAWIGAEENPVALLWAELN